MRSPRRPLQKPALARPCRNTRRTETVLKFRPKNPPSRCRMWEAFPKLTGLIPHSLFLGTEIPYVALLLREKVQDGRNEDTLLHIAHYKIYKVKQRLRCGGQYESASLLQGRGGFGEQVPISIAQSTHTQLLKWAQRRAFHFGHPPPHSDLFSSTRNFSEQTKSM